MGIFILEDNFEQKEFLHRVVEKLVKKNHIINGTIISTTSVNRLLEAIQYNGEYNIFFLDLNIKNDTTAGLEVAKQIRKVDEESEIVIVSSHPNLALVSYQYMISVLSFIDKSSDIDSFIKQIERCLLKYNNTFQRTVQHKDWFFYESKFTDIRVPFNEIRYITTSDRHRILIKTTTRDFQFYGILADIENNDQRLVRCHQSYIVNITAISEIDKSKNVIYLDGGFEIPISRRMKKKVSEEWRNFLTTKTTE
ncbi:response regulator transcription factor [Vagococcus sp. BWB3-3]|uniref:Response regulator transcription factor n=1 Tax=Vagococcus allomyrinae TaxID=2794353 RepID=A0A940SXK7_9ENTE|nr:LytTR family DNA-binding domain-containing protein [Vagococcus allomyrinae]MBP1044219.1 response regulator transcription factor [Vagococcus allomyrinae]